MLRSIHTLAVLSLVAVSFALVASPAHAASPPEVALRYQCKAYKSRTFPSAGEAMHLYNNLKKLNFQVSIHAGKTFNEYIIQYRCPTLSTHYFPTRQVAANWLQYLVENQIDAYTIPPARKG